MSDQENKAQSKVGKLKKNGDPDLRSLKSAMNVSKARTKVKAFIKAGQQIISPDSDEDSGDEIIDLVIRKKNDKPDMNMDQEEDNIIRRKPLKEVLKKTKKKKTKRVQPIETDDEEDEEEEEEIKPKIRTKKEPKEDKTQLELDYKALQSEFDIMKQGITKREASNTDIDILRKKMILRF